MQRTRLTFFPRSLFLSACCTSRWFRLVFGTSAGWYESSPSQSVLSHTLFWQSHLSRRTPAMDSVHYIPITPPEDTRQQTSLHGKPYNVSVERFQADVTFGNLLQDTSLCCSTPRSSASTMVSQGITNFLRATYTSSRWRICVSCAHRAYTRGCWGSTPPSLIF